MIDNLISVIMPAYNTAHYISTAIESLIDQTYSNWELIIIDDGSVDDTSKIVNEWLGKDRRIQYFRQENSKQGKARNLGISKSQGFYLAFLDADDIWLPEKLEIQIREIKKKNVDLVFSNSYVFKDNKLNDILESMNIPGNVFYDRHSIGMFLEVNRIPILTVLAKKQKRVNVGGFSEKLDIQNVEDYHLWLKMLMSDCEFYSLNYILAKYRIHNNSATADDKLALDKIPNAFFDLIQLYPTYKKQIQFELKLKFNFIYKENLFTRLELNSYIKKNTLYLSKSFIGHLYLFLNFLLPTKFTKRLLIYILNA